MSRFLARYSMTNESVAESRRAREAEWQAMHRQPDTPPNERAVTPVEGTSRFSLITLVRRVAGLRPGSQRLTSRSRHRA
jgi:hypothetical protein